MAQNINKDVVYKAAKSKEKDYMLNDGGGLYLFVGKNGTTRGATRKGATKDRIIVSIHAPTRGAT